ncbi:MAG: efflux RND transporter permease subunit [Alphaproteobacteria bacterium]|nr:MAG: efflux RND transporter permease subunit [Alphaproteobacteria bacterium]
MAGLIGHFTRHRTAANLLMLLMLGLGLAAVPQMRSQFFPDVVIETVKVRVAWPGAGPEEVDAGIVQILEPPLLGVDGVAESRATSREGVGVITLEFEPGTDMARATEEVRRVVEGVTDLPEDAETPEVTRGAWRDRVTDVVITAPVPIEQLAGYADALVARLFRAGVTRTTLKGISAPQIRVEPRQEALERNDVTLAEVAAAIGREARDAPAGQLAGGAARLSAGTERRRVDEIADVVIRTRPDGSRLRVGDVARVSLRGPDRGRAFYVRGQPAAVIRVDRSAGGDAIAIQRRVGEVAREFAASMPPGSEVRLVRTRAEAISKRLSMLLRNGATGLVLVLALLFLFLSARTAFWVAAGIPAAVGATVALMYAAGLSINMISLFALIITIGIIVDDAIVVGEHADFRARRLGEPPERAAERAALRMAAPVLSASVTTIIAFLGLAALSGRFGDLIADIPFTVAVVLTASLIECFLVLPHHMARSLPAPGARPGRIERILDAPSALFNRGFGWVRERLFRPLTALVLRGRYAVLAGALALLASQVALVLSGEVRWRFFNAPELGTITINFALVEGASRDDTRAVMERILAAAETLAARYEREHGANPISFALGSVGGAGGRGLPGAETKDRDLLGSITLELIDADARPYSAFAFLADLKRAVPRLPVVEQLSFRSFRRGPGGDAIDVSLTGASLDRLKQAAEALKAELGRWSEVSAIEDDLPWGRDEIRLELTPLGRALGLDAGTLSRVLRDRMTGITAARFPAGPRSAEVLVIMDQRDRQADVIERSRLRVGPGRWVQLADVVRVRRSGGFAVVRRENGLPVVRVTADVSEDDPARAAEIDRALVTRILPDIASRYGVEWQLGGLKEQERRFERDALIGFLLALGGIYLTLAWVFASWTRPAVVMAVIPFGLIGAIQGHWQWGLPLSMFSVVGLIGMSGIIINDAIVLISTVDEYARSRGLRPAIIDAVADRLRPVMLTTLTTVFGIAPLLYETSRQAQFLRPTVITLAWGLGFGMVLVLLVVPALLAVQEDWRRALAGLRRGLAGPAPRRVAALRWPLRAALMALLGALALAFGPLAAGSEP